MPSFFVRAIVLVSALGLCACRGAQPPATAPQSADAGSVTGLDPAPVDEALLEALQSFRDRFACNAISGCPAEAVLIGFGWAARPHLEQMFQRAPKQATYRARAVRALAELRDPQALPFLRRVATDSDPEARGYAVLGIGLLGAREERANFEQLADSDRTVWSAAPRLSALWVLRRWGDPTAEARFLEELRLLTSQQMAGPALTWGLELCARPEGPSCDAVLPAAARHGNFTVRRAAIRAIAVHPTPALAPVLVMAAADPIHSLAEVAERALRELSGRQDLQGAGAWRDWCAQTKCDQPVLDPEEQP